MQAIKRFGPLVGIALGLILAISMGWHKYLSFDVLAKQSEVLRDLVTTKPFYPLRCLTQRDTQERGELLEITEREGVAPPPFQSLRWIFGFQVQLQSLDP